MKKNWVLTQDAFDALLAWLSPDRDEAGRTYEQIRQRLIKIFSCRGCADPEDLADETINRVANKLKDIEPDFVGEPGRYFYGVANKIQLEYMRRKPPPEVPPPTDDDRQDEREFECLDRCIQKLSTENRQLVLEYYQNQGKTKIDHRKRIAESLGIAINALRIRAFRLRASLQECVSKCLSEAAV